MDWITKEKMTKAKIAAHDQAVARLQGLVDDTSISDLVELVSLAETECLCEYERAKMAEEQLQELFSTSTDAALPRSIRHFQEASDRCQHLGRTLLTMLGKLDAALCTERRRPLAALSVERSLQIAHDTERCPPAPGASQSPYATSLPSPVLLVSPFGGSSEDKRRNLSYARRCARHCLDLGEAPFGAHLIYPQLLDDDFAPHRSKGITAGLSWASLAVRAVVYVDHGITSGMQEEIKHCRLEGKPIVERNLPLGYAELDLSLPMAAFSETRQ